ncbi:MAG TPA: sigma 54-interacting transcriptional regulator [Candidatus Sulfotelmatobacter sp.]|nr:sigma 54-interacting transcriptional regulator [Candidatus Sulfotelmatobacter sp.]
MRPRLLVLSGPLKDSTIPLAEGEITIGREASNGIAVVDPSVSRKHCAILGREGRFQVRDLESRNGTMVNGTVVEEQWLQHGDEIGAGDSCFLFLLEEGEVTAPGRVEFEEGQRTAETTVIHPRDVVYLQPDRLSRELPVNSQVARNLNALLKISRVVHAIRDLDELQGQLLDLIFEVVPAGRGAILLADKEGHQFNSMFARMRQAGQTPLVKVSRTVARQVLEQGIAILGTDVAGSSDLRDVESLAASQVRSLLCVPLTVFQRVIGCIYVDSNTPGTRLHEEHLVLVTAIAGISAVALENARRLQWLEQENERLTVEVSQERSLVGEGAQMKQVYQFLKRVAPTDSTVLIEGESGTGKELAARALHRNSPRASKPFVAINCAAIPETLLESDLFGHERGAFTGASGLKKGRLEVADSGVVFLDEIGELAPALQVKLLRVLQEREFERVGGNHPIKVDIRLIAATNCDLEQAVRDGAFRKDLYYRLAVLKVTMPTLRERREDIPMLARHFVQKHAKRCKVKPRPISREALSCLQNYDWPGNVRELENAIERALVLGSSDMILPEDLPESLLERNPAPDMIEATYHAALKELKKQLIRNAVEQTQGSYADAARILGVHPNYLHRLIRNLELKESLKDALREVSPRGLSGLSGGNA